MTLSEFFSKDYLFSPNTPSESRLYIPLIILFGALILLAILAKLMRKADMGKISDKYFVSFLTIGILGFIHLFCRYEELPGLGSRFILLLILALLAVWVVVNSLWTLRFIPKYKEEKKLEERYNKYLPKIKNGQQTKRTAKKIKP